MSAPLLAWSDLRIDRPDRPERAAAFDGASAETKGSRVLILGAPRALFLAVAGELSVARGRLAIAGNAADDARRSGALAIVRFDRPMPPAWSAERYVTWSARLAGQEPAAARDAARRALTLVGIAPKAKLGDYDARARDRVALATAAASKATVIAIDDPFAARTDATAAALEERILAVLSDRAWLVFAARAPLASAIVRAADHTMVIAASDVVAEGSAASIASLARSYVLRFAKPATTAATAANSGEDATAAFTRVASASDRGIEVSSRGDATVVVLPAELGTRALFPIAASANLAIVELRPLAGPLA